jgi:clan AA aspartic protease (TIGR02281 family)
MYANGVGVEKNPAEAEKWNQLASRPRGMPQTSPVKQAKPAEPVQPPAAEDGRLWETHARQCKESLAKGDYALAIEACQASLEEAERFGRHDRRLAISSWFLASLYHAQGRYAEAEPLYRRSLEIMEKTLGPNHPDVATILNNLAELYREQGRYAEAEPLYRRSLEIRSHGAKGRPTAKSPGAVPKQSADIHPSGNGNPTMILAADAQGHFITMGSINGASVRMLVDTGATSVSMSTDEAWRIGLSYLNGKRVRIHTANGIVTGYRVMLDTVEVGNITLNQVEGEVREGSIGVAQESIVLLGMSFLNRVEMKREGTELTLIKKN